MRRFYAPIENFSPGCVSLDVDESRHLRDVLRLREGDEVSVFDGEGREFLCGIRQINKRFTELAIIAETAPYSRESTLDLILAPAILKGEKYDLVIQKAVELGVTMFIPIKSIRCEVKLKDSEKRVDRWQKIVLEASKQSGRAKLMRIAQPIEFKTFLVNCENGNAVLFSEKNGAEFSTIKAGKKIIAIIGPEGGWDDSELEIAKSHGAKIVTLGGRILRAETAAISTTALLQNRFGDIN